uniref:Uncharacterized protein n=1 Tax=Arundo donax TaxID=35708 RepID=A0A0A9EDT6_ARUDO
MICSGSISTSSIIVAAKYMLSRPVGTVLEISLQLSIIMHISIVCYNSLVEPSFY